MDSDPTGNSQVVVTLVTPESQEALAAASSSVQHDHTYSSQATPTDPTPSVAESHGTEELLSQELFKWKSLLRRLYRAVAETIQHPSAEPTLLTQLTLLMLTLKQQAPLMQT